ncbi:MAG: hypothetical protein V7K27_05895 [Nostoc sp.]|uniref:hypothetical protein n=1 Tax=Nostoc sp. TaxID=1180 RepID=UPI002FF93579
MSSVYPALARNLDLSFFGNGTSRYLVSFSSAIIASCGKKAIGSWHEFWVGIIDYILLWDAGRLPVRDIVFSSVKYLFYS